MNKVLVFLLFVLCSFNGFGQVKSVFFDAEDKVTTDSTKAESYAIYGKVTGDSIYIFKKYDLDGYLMVTGSFKDEGLTIPHGKFVYYDWINPYDSFTNHETVARGKERYITLSGNFKNGRREGRWVSYYVNGDVKDVANYKGNLLNGEYKSFEANGNLKESGQFVNNKKEGEWSLKGGLQVVTFKNDKVIATVNKTRKQLKKEKEQQSQSKL